MIVKAIILNFLIAFSMHSHGMGSKQPSPLNIEKVKDNKPKKILVHVLDTKFEGSKKALKKEIYQIILDEIINTEKFSLMLNKPDHVRKARIKFVEIHTEVRQIKGTEGSELFSAGVFLADGNTGKVILQEVGKDIPESRLRFFIRKTLRSFFFSDIGEKKTKDPDIALMDDSNQVDDYQDKKKRGSESLKAGNVFNPLFEKRKKTINISGGESSKEPNSKYAKDSYEDLIPYSFRKKKTSDLLTDNKKDAVDVPSNNIKKTSSVSTMFAGKRSDDDNFLKRDAVPGYYLDYGVPTILSQEFSRSIQEYAEDSEKIKNFTDNRFSEKKKELTGNSQIVEDGQIGLREKGDFKPISRSPGQTIYSLGVNFMVDKVESSDSIQITNNFKQVGISVDMDKYVSGSRGEKISTNVIIGFPVDYDEQFEVPGSIRARVGYHKGFSDFFLAVGSLEYERQFFVNVAKAGDALQAWQNTILWYNLGFDLAFEVFSNQLILSAYFSKPFVGNTNYGGENNRTMDGNRVYGKTKLQLYRNVSIKSEIFWSEMTSQGLSDLKNNHLTTATYLIYSF